MLRLQDLEFSPSASEVLGAMHYLGWQGGTIHQVLAEIETASDYPRGFGAWFKGKDHKIGRGHTKTAALMNLFEQMEDYT